MARLLLGQVTCSLSAWVKATQKLALPSPAIPHCADSFSFYPLNAGVPPGLRFWPFSLITLSNWIYFHGFKLLRNPIPQAPILNAHLRLTHFQLNCPTDLKLVRPKLYCKYNLSSLSPHPNLSSPVFLLSRKSITHNPQICGSSFATSFPISQHPMHYQFYLLNIQWYAGKWLTVTFPG